MKLATAKDQIEYIVGRIEGMAGTVRYDLTEEVRAELREIARKLKGITVD